MAYGTVNADVIGTSVAGSNLGAGNASAMKNRVINGGMKVTQRGTGSVTAIEASATFPVDRFFVYSSPTSKFTAQVTTANPQNAGGQTSCLGLTSSSAFTVTSSTIAVLEHRIEGYNVSDLQYGYATAKTVTLSFWVYCSLTGTFGGSLIAGSGSRSYPFTYTVTTANTWQQISITVAGDTTTQTNTTTGTGMIISWSMGTGSSYNGTAGSWQDGELYGATGAQSLISTNGATYYITGVQLEVGSSATGFEFRPYGTELALCQRYYEVITTTTDPYTLQGAFTTGTSFRSHWFPKVTKRTAPTFALVNGATWSNTPSIFTSIDDVAFYNGSNFYYVSQTAGVVAASLSAEL